MVFHIQEILGLSCKILTFPLVSDLNLAMTRRLYSVTSLPLLVFMMATEDINNHNIKLCKTLSVFASRYGHLHYCLFLANLKHS